MKKLHFIIVPICALFVAASTAYAVPLLKTDAQRVCDVLEIAETVERFKKTTGHYPYQEALLEPEEDYVAVPATVNIYRGELPERYRHPPPDLSGYVYTLEDFENYLSDALGKKIHIPVDGRPIDERSFPTFYQFKFDGAAYYVAAILEAERPDTRMLAPGHHKYQVSSVSVPEKKIKAYKTAKSDCDR